MRWFLKVTTATAFTRDCCPFANMLLNNQVAAQHEQSETTTAADHSVI
jgi:hypothetical protein